MVSPKSLILSSEKNGYLRNERLLISYIEKFSFIGMVPLTCWTIDRAHQTFRLLWQFDVIRGQNGFLKI